jgi:hypothetical protein
MTECIRSDVLNRIDGFTSASQHETFHVASLRATESENTVLSEKIE